jgi:hypothetical protein
MSSPLTYWSEATMTKNQRRQFYKKLKKYKNLFIWDFDGYDAIRAETDGELFCPITAIAYAETNHVYDIDDAGKDFVDIKIPITEEDREEIIWAADAPIRCNSFTKSELAMRKTILRIVGLEEPDGIDPNIEHIPDNELSPLKVAKPQNT